ncbi:MAG: riboflavin synthase [Acidimicrobiia bacterium]
MFTGIVQEMGTVVDVAPASGGSLLRIGSPETARDLDDGASVAVNGCCLTVTSCDGDTWAAQAVIETLDRTTLGRLVPGDRVNLERPVRADGLLDGHVVSGHVDGVGTVAERTSLPDGSTHLTVEVPDGLSRYIVTKGSIAVDGVSLTVTGVAGPPEAFGVAVIPHTAAVTTLGGRNEGDTVNIEVDVLAKYVERLLDRSES